MFCSLLTNINIPESVSSIGERAFGYSGITNITVDENNEHYKSVDGDLYSKDGKVLIQYAIGKKGEFTIPNNVTSIAPYAFYVCDYLSSVTIPDGVISIGKFAFYSCGRLTSVTIPDSVTSIGSSAFSYCTSLTSVNIPKNLTSIESTTFCGCDIASISIPNSVTNIGYSAFNSCEKLESIYFDGTVEQWKNVERGSGWNAYIGAYTIYCTDGTISQYGKITYY